MAVFIALEFIGALAIVWFVVTQVVAPIVTGRRMFPMFSRRAKLHDELRDIHEEQDIVNLERKVESERKNLDRLKNVRAVDADSDKKEKV